MGNSIGDIRKPKGGSNLLAIHKLGSADPSLARVMGLDRRLYRDSSTWERHNPQQIEDQDDVARAITNDGTCYVSTRQIGLVEAYCASRIKALVDERVRGIRLNAKGLSASQADCADLILRSRVSILTGGPGTGKTYTLCALADSLEAAGASILYASPTGTAAKRMGLSIGVDRHPTTIHRLLGYKQGKFTVTELAPLDCDYLITDESTMEDIFLFYAMLRALPRSASLILVGDADQLPPVGIGSPFHALLGVVPTARLTEVRRTDPDGPIGQACQSILRGVLPDQAMKGDKGFFLVPKADNQLTKFVLKCACRMSHFDVNKVGIFSPFNYTVEHINQYFLEHSRSYPLGKYPVMCLKNDYEEMIFNGETGLTPYWPSEYFDFEGRQVCFRKWRDTLAFARTGHKSQGGEWDDVIVHCPKNKFMSRNLSYVEVSRGKSRVVVTGDIGSFRDSLSESRSDNRVSLLGKLVTGEARIL